MTPKPRILIVDDEERFRVTLSKLLAANNLEVANVGSGKEALIQLTQNSYDVILLDVKMPEMDGVETLAEIKKIDPLVEVIILTGHASVDIAVDIMRLGGYEYLLKPCPMDELMEKIDTAYERKVGRESRAQKASVTQTSQSS